MLALALLQLSSDGGIFDTIGDISFVIKLMALVYIVFYLYQTLAESQVLFGLAALGAGYFILFYSSVFIALAIVVLLMMTGMWLQQALQFGLFPLLGVGMMEQGGGGEIAKIQQKMNSGLPVSHEEMAMMEEQMAAEQQQRYMQAGMRRAH